MNEIESRQILESVEFEGKTVESMRALSAEIDSDFVTAYKHVCKTLQGSLMRREPGVSVIITLGDKGVVYSSFSDSDNDITVHYEPAITNVNVVDTTGAGDTFLGGLVTQLYQGVPLGGQFLSAVGKHADHPETRRSRRVYRTTAMSVEFRQAEYEKGR